VNGIPDSVEVWDFVREEFDQIKCQRNSEHPGMRKNLQSGRQMEYAEALEKPKRGYGGIEIQSGGESSAQREAEGFDGIHAGTS